MKYIISAIIAVSLFSLSASAAVGDIAGNIYTTDIAADVDGMPIKSYNIGGKTAIVIEELRDYGFCVEWKPEDRLLVAKTGYLPGNPPSYSHKKEVPGKIAGKIYETDIKVFLNGIEVPSFNIGGLTAVAIEDIGNLPKGKFSYDGNAHRGMDKHYNDVGMYHIWNPDTKTVSLYTLRPGTAVETDYGTFTIGDTAGYVERISYIKSSKAMSANDGRYYTTYADGIEIDGRLYVMLYDIMEIFGGSIDALGDAVNIKSKLPDNMHLRYEDSALSRNCQNILYPLTQKLMVNEIPANSAYPDFYLYKNEVFVSADSLNAASGSPLIKSADILPQGVGQKLGSILYSGHILYINGRAVSSYLADNGEYYIPVDELENAKFDILSAFDDRIVKTPEEMPDIIAGKDNLPPNYFTASGGIGILCDYYEGFHNVKIDSQAVSSVYVHYHDAYYSPCISLSELVRATGCIVEKSAESINVYTRSDKLTLSVDEEISNILVYKSGEIVKKFPINEYQDIGVFDEYLYLSLYGDEGLINEIYNIDTLEKVAEVAGNVQAIKNNRIFTYVNAEDGGEWARRYFIYDMSGKLIETYVDKN